MQSSYGSRHASAISPRSVRRRARDAQQVPEISKVRVLGLGFKVKGAQSLRFRALSLGFRALGFGFEVHGLGL